MALTTAERNKRKRERKKREREEQQKLEEQKQNDASAESAAPAVEIEYVAELPRLENNDEAFQEEEMQQVLHRFQSRAAVYVSEDEGEVKPQPSVAEGIPTQDPTAEPVDEEEEEETTISKRKLKSLLRPTVSQLKQRVSHPELVEAHDVTAPDPEFLIYLKGIPGTVPVPRHWGRKRKYLQGKRGVEKAPFALPDFIVKTGICSVRDATKEDEEKMSIKQKNRQRVSGKGGTDVDYRTLYEAFFRHQTKPVKMTTFGDLYYEGKEYETAKSCNYRVGFMSETLREALGMPNESSPCPWLINMQRFGPPPSYPNVRIPGEFWMALG
jgi:splicing factor 3B subunit 2